MKISTYSTLSNILTSFLSIRNSLEYLTCMLGGGLRREIIVEDFGGEKNKNIVVTLHLIKISASSVCLISKNRKIKSIAKLISGVSGVILFRFHRFSNEGQDCAVFLNEIANSVIISTDNDRTKSISLDNIKWQSDLCYLISGLSKAVSPRWRSGQALDQILLTDIFGNHKAYRTIKKLSLSTPLSRLTILLEILIPFLVRSRFKKVVTPAVIAFHFSLFLVMKGELGKFFIIYSLNHASHHINDLEPNRFKINANEKIIYILFATYYTIGILANNDITKNLPIVKHLARYGLFQWKLFGKDSIDRDIKLLLTENGNDYHELYPPDPSKGNLGIFWHRERRSGKTLFLLLNSASLELSKNKDRKFLKSVENIVIKSDLSRSKKQIRYAIVNFYTTSPGEISFKPIYISKLMNG